jgi:hypothetical protein
MLPPTGNHVLPTGSVRLTVFSSHDARWVQTLLGASSGWLQPGREEPLCGSSSLARRAWGQAMQVSLVGIEGAYGTLIFPDGRMAF